MRPTVHADSQPLFPCPLAPLSSAPKGLRNLSILMRTAEHLRPISRTFQPSEGGGLRIPNRDSKAGEWTSGVSPKVPRRTVCDTLMSYGSHRPYRDSSKGEPVDGQSRLSVDHLLEPAPSFARMFRKFAVFPASPVNERTVKMTKYSLHRCFVEMAVSVQPSSQCGVVAFSPHHS